MRDPLGMVDGPNVYAYVMGSPVNNIDPSGLASCPPGWQNHGNVFVGPHHPAYGHVDAHWHVRIPGSPHELRVNAQGIIQKGKYKGQLLRNQSGWRGAVRTLTRVGIIVFARIILFPIITISDPALWQLPNDYRNCRA